MWTEKNWIMLAAIGMMTNRVICESLLFKTSENNVQNHDINTIHSEGFRIQNRTISKLNSYLYFGDIMANALKDFVPFSYVNEKCTRDGQLFVMEFNNQSQWAVKCE